MKDYFKVVNSSHDYWDTLYVHIPLKVDTVGSSLIDSQDQRSCNNEDFRKDHKKVEHRIIINFFLQLLRSSSIRNQETLVQRNVIMYMGFWKYKCNQGFTWESTLLMLRRNGLAAPIDRKFETNEREFFLHYTRLIWNSTALTRKQWNVVFIVSFNYKYPLRINIQILAKKGQRWQSVSKFLFALW